VTEDGTASQIPREFASAGTERVGAELVGAEPVGAELVGAEPVGAEPVGAEPSPTVTATPAFGRRIFVDITPLRVHRDYRRLFMGTLVSTLGAQLTVVAVPFQVYRQTHSSLQVGAVSLAQLVPLIIGALAGGTVGDAIDRRTMMWITGAALALTSAALALNALAAHPALWLIYVVSALTGALIGFSNTARAASSATLVGPHHQPAAAALTQIVFQLGTVVGPAVSGLLIATVGLSWVYGLDAITYVISVMFIRSMAAIPPVPGATRPGLASVAEGVRFLKGNHSLQGIYIIDLNAMVFGMPRALFPALALGPLHAGVRGVGYLFAAPGVGALLGSVGSGWVAHVRRQGLAVLVAVVVWGTAITVFGFVHVLGVALVLLAAAGWADVVSAVLRNTILQTTVTEEFRSRLSSIQMAVVQGGPRLGDLESGAVASAVSTEFSVVSGGIACIVGALVTAACLPGFVRHEARASPPRSAEGARHGG
jgi:MFS family permease